MPSSPKDTVLMWPQAEVSLPCYSSFPFCLCLLASSPPWPMSGRRLREVQGWLGLPPVPQPDAADSTCWSPERQCASETNFPKWRMGSLTSFFWLRANASFKDKGRKGKSFGSNHPIHCSLPSWEMQESEIGLLGHSKSSLRSGSAHTLPESDTLEEGRKALCV